MTYEYVPGPFELFLLAVASFRLWRLLAEDDILDGPRMWLLRLPRGWGDGDVIPPEYREKWATFFTCPACAGFWISAIVWGLWLWQPEWTLAASALLTMSAAVIVIRKNLDDPDK